MTLRAPLNSSSRSLEPWQQFIVENGWRAPAHELATVLDKSVAEIIRFRQAGVCTRLPKHKQFAELFVLWYGRPPQNEEWPIPRKFNGHYEWQGPELALLASLVGTIDVIGIAKTLTVRLRKLTRDHAAERNRNGVQLAINRLGLYSTDVLGGITTKEAGNQVGSIAIVREAIRKKQLKTKPLGRLLVITHDSWNAWKKKRVFPPRGYVQLSTIKEALSIRSDKLSEFARAGNVPTAIRCTPMGAKGTSTKFGTWYVDKKVAAQLVADRRAGRPMPWHGKPIPENLRITFKLWEKRRHPASCQTCAEIWGPKGAPRSYDDYAVRYPLLAFGAKRHLTRPWTPGLTIAEVAVLAKDHCASCDEARVRLAVRNGVLEAKREGNRLYVSRTDATRWHARKCPTGEGPRSWITLEIASSQYLFTLAELRRFIAAEKLKSKTHINDEGKKEVHISRHQCGQLREKIGFTEEQAARRAGVTIPRFRLLLEGVDWRKAESIPLATVQAVIKRLESHQGYTIEEAAIELTESANWVLARIHDGTIRVLQAKWDRRRVYITEPMMKRLREYKQNPVKKKRLGQDWLRVSEASHEAGVCGATIYNWAERGDLPRRMATTGWHYHREAVRACARTYWRTVRFHRAVPPDWLQAELKIKDNYDVIN